MNAPAPSAMHELSTLPQITSVSRLSPISSAAWAVSVPIAFVLSRFTDLPVVAIYCSVTAADFIKCVIGFILVKKGVWAKHITEEI